MDFREVINIEELHTFLEKFFKVTCLNVTLFDLDCKPLTQAQGTRKFCLSLRDTPMGLQCGESNVKGLKEAYYKKKPNIYSCYSGLTDIAIPIFINSRIVGSAVTGQLVIDQNNSLDASISHLEHLIKIHNIDDQKADQLRQDIRSVPCLSKHAVENIIDMLSFMISYIIKAEKEKRKLQEEVSTKYEHLKAITDAKVYIEMNYDNNELTLDKLASIACMEKKYFIKIFKEIDGNTPHEYIIQTKIKAAMKMLQHDNELTIDKLSEYVGYDTPHFSRLFKKKVGMTPSAYKALLMQSSDNKNF
jgi:ligand-binding sensor protein/AraC-like DNA-binding protein